MYFGVEKEWVHKLISMFFHDFFTVEALNYATDVVETCDKIKKCGLNTFLAIRKRYNTIAHLKKKLWKIEKKGVGKKSSLHRTVGIRTNK